MVKNLFDKIFFTIGAIMFLQLPHFIEQYTQRLGGYATSQAEQISEYQVIADQHFGGDLVAYQQRLESNDDPAVADSAKQISKRISYSSAINQDLEVYQLEPMWYQIPYFFAHLRMDLVQGTAKNFSPGLPINFWAWIYGLMGGILFSLLFGGLTRIPAGLKKRSNKKKPNLQNQA